MFFLHFCLKTKSLFFTSKFHPTSKMNNIWSPLHTGHSLFKIERESSGNSFSKVPPRKRRKKSRKVLQKTLLTSSSFRFRCCSQSEKERKGSRERKEKGNSERKTLETQKKILTITHNAKS